jgi:transposase-like protein DUF772
MKNSMKLAATKSPLSLAEEALSAGEAALPTRFSKFSRQDFRPAQLFAILVLRQFFKTDYRGIVRLLSEFAELREVLGLRKVPHYSTLCYAERRLLKKPKSIACWLKTSVSPASGA